MLIEYDAILEVKRVYLHSCMKASFICTSTTLCNAVSFPACVVTQRVIGRHFSFTGSISRFLLIDLLQPGLAVQYYACT